MNEPKQKYTNNIVYFVLTTYIGKPFNSVSTPKLKENLCVKQLLHGTANFVVRQMAY